MIDIVHILILLLVNYPMQVLAGKIYRSADERHARGRVIASEGGGRWRRAKGPGAGRAVQQEHDTNLSNMMRDNVSVLRYVCTLYECHATCSRCRVSSALGTMNTIFLCLLPPETETIVLRL